MRILKKILIVLAIIIAIPLIAALFIKGDYAVERQTVINKPKQEVFEYVKHINNQDNYSVWNRKDPNMKKESIGTDGTVGYVVKWDSENDEVGKGEQEITSIVEGERLESQLRFKKPFEATDNAYMVTEPAGENQTTVKWGFTGKMPYPFNLMCVFMSMDKMVGGDMEKGLANLKNVMEKGSL